MTDESRKAAWENLNVTKDELNRIGDALKNAEFRKLLLDYAEEISDPVNKKIYEAEITQMEKERGVDCTFINPEPGYVIKSSIDGKRKAFINICKNDHVGKPTSTQTTDSSGVRGSNWSLPYTQAPPRDDLDKKNVRCSVFDVVFHPETHLLAEKNPQFRKMISETAMDAVEKSFNVKLDRKNIRFPKMAYKGAPRAAVIRKKSANPPPESDECSTFPPNYPYPYPVEPEITTTIPLKPSKTVDAKDDDSPFTTPKHTMKYRSNVDIQEYTYEDDAKMNSVIPKELVISIFLPLLRTTADVTLDVHDRWIELKSEKTAKYFLHLPLPYEVNDALGNARFDQSERKLVITLPVKPSLKSVADINRFDSGNESDLHHGDSDEGTETKPNPKIQVLSESVSVAPKQTSVTVAPSVANSFLNPDLHYSPVTYTCNINEDIMAFTLHVKNVDAESVKHFSSDPSSFHIRFTSVGAGFFPIHHALFVRLPAPITVIADRISVETWDNNVVAQLALSPTGAALSEYFVGVDEQTATRCELSEPTAIAARLEDLTLVEADSGLSVKRATEADGALVVELAAMKINEEAVEKVVVECVPETKPVTIVAAKPPGREIEKIRYFSESSGEELGCATLAKRGILKKRLSVSRSLSESNMDDLSSSTSSLDPFPTAFGSDLCIVEEVDDNSTASPKKSVHFNDKIAKKIFRFDSCILSQKKKNQRKSQNKKRALLRRASESEASEADGDKSEDNNEPADVVAPCTEPIVSANDSTATILPFVKAGSPVDNQEIPAAVESANGVAAVEVGDGSKVSIAENGVSKEAGRGKRQRRQRKGRKNSSESEGRISSGNSREGSPDEEAEVAGKNCLSQGNGAVINGKDVQKQRRRNQKDRKELGQSEGKLSSSSDSRDGSPDLPTANGVEITEDNAMRIEATGGGDGNHVGTKSDGKVSVGGDVVLEKTDNAVLKKGKVINGKKANAVKQKKTASNQGIFQNLETQKHASMKIEELGFQNDLIFDLDM